MADNHSQATATQQNIPVVAAQIDRGKSDYAMLVNYLRARQRDLHAGTYRTDNVFMTLAEDSPLYWFVYFASLQLMGLKVVIQSVTVPAYPYSDFAQTVLQKVSRDNLRTALAMVNKQGVADRKSVV